VDDGSIDNTVDIVKKHASLSSRTPSTGRWGGLRLGYDIAMSSGAKIIVTMDADGQHLPEEIERLCPDFEWRLGYSYRVARIGTAGKGQCLPMVGIHVFNSVINLLAGTKITDCSNGFRAFRMESLKNVLLVQDQFHTAELIIDAARKGMSIGEAPITVLRRHPATARKAKIVLRL